MTDRTEAMDNLIAQDADLIEICPDHLVLRLRDLAEEWFEMCDDIHKPLYEAAERIEALTAENERLRGTLLWIRGICAEELDLEYTDAMRRAFQRNVRDAVLKTLTNPEAGQPWLRTYDAHLKRECERCCGNGQTYGPNSGEDIVCPDCEGTGRVD
jgi:hypothetical protein